MANPTTDPKFLHSQLELKLPYPTHDFSDQTIIVTGANVGLGFEAARHFTRLNAAKVILAVRSESKGAAAKADIERTTQRLGVVEVYPLDLSSYASVKKFAAMVSELPRIDVLLENAGIGMTEFQMMEDNESSITVNVVSTFLLAFLLLPTLRRSGEKFGIVPRICVVSSAVHAWIKFSEWKADNIFATLNSKETANMNERYQLSKLLEILTVREMVHKLRPSPPTIIINTINPGLCHSELTRHLSGERAAAMEKRKAEVARSTEEGSRTLVHAAGPAGEKSQGGYLDDCEVRPESLSEFVRSAEGAEAQKKVWGELVAKLEVIQSGITDLL